jgi:hypothetical protein
MATAAMVWLCGCTGTAPTEREWLREMQSPSASVATGSALGQLEAAIAQEQALLRQVEAQQQEVERLRTANTSDRSHEAALLRALKRERDLRLQLKRAQQRITALEAGQ